MSDYINFPDAEGGDLPGAEQDARRIRDVLVMEWEARDGMLDKDIVELFIKSRAYTKVLERDWREF